MYESQFEEKLYNERREKLRQIAALGQKAGLTYAEATYPNHYAATTTIPELLPLGRRADGSEKSAEELAAEHIEVSIAGRLMAIRLQGKAGFAQLQQNGQRIQIYVRKDDVGEDAFALYKLLDLGDHIGVKGFLMRTRTGELTVHVAPIHLPGHEGKPALTFLAKAMLALPDKYHGLEDTELRYRQRYVDLFMNTGNSPKPAIQSSVILSEATAGSEVEGPAVPASEADGPGNVREVFVKRAAILRALRTFFDAHGYLEVETPMMHTVAGGAAARPFLTHHNALDLDLKLRIAPELYLKRLVVGGLDRVYEINRNFRNEGISTQHNPEFTMLEFYQAYSNYHDLMELTKKLVAEVAMEVNGTTLVPLLDEDGNQVDLAPENWRKLSMQKAIIKWWPEKATPTPQLDDLATLNNFKPFVEALETHFAQEKARLVAEREQIHSTFPDSSEKAEVDMPDVRAQIHKITDSMVALDTKRWTLNRTLRLYDGKAYATVFETLAEPHLIQPTIIYDFPLAVSPLSKIKPDEPEWVERFEFYIGGFEIGNAFSELNDPDDQRARFEAQLEERARGDDEAMPMDEDYIRALGYGLPPTAGEGIGIDRLTMVLTGARSIRDVILFPLLRPQTKPQE